MLLELRLRAAELSLCLVALLKNLLHIWKTRMMSLRIFVWRTKSSDLDGIRRCRRATYTGWKYFCDCNWLIDLLRVLNGTHMIHLLINIVCLGGKWLARDYSIFDLVHFEKFVSIKRSNSVRFTKLQLS